jgi:hypothetical protein
MKRTPHIVISLVAALGGCAQSSSDKMGKCGALASKADSDAPTDPLAMPTDMVAWQRHNMWGSMHVAFHTSRRWDIMSQAGRDWAMSQGIQRADLQEGEVGSGLEFLAMHRLMIQRLKTQFPSEASLFDGFKPVPTDPNDQTWPLPDGSSSAFSSTMLGALDKLNNHIGDFTSDDDMALYLQTNLRWTASNPSGRSSDPSTGIHNYLHVRFTDDNSPINVGDPSVNLENKIFWGIHGWIDATWTAYRAAKSLDDTTDPVFLEAMKHAQDVMDATSGGKFDGEQCIDVPSDIQKELTGQ